MNDTFQEQKKIDRLLRWCEENETSILTHEQFPPLLKRIPYPPQFLFFRGNPEVLKKPMLAIVGARAASPYGLASAYHFARELSAAGLVIISGLAKGVDGAGHWGAVNRGGETLAVMGAGFSHLYPRENRKLAFKILEKGGAWLSEYCPWVPPLPIHFPQRNRIISGLSQGIVVIEARKKSGSLITALSGLEQGREVFVIPGPIDKPDYEGSHSLIQQGAKLVRNPKEVLEELVF
jgi:DNA processing protein